MKLPGLATLFALALPISSLAAEEVKVPKEAEAHREAFLAMEEHMKISALEMYPAAGVPGTPLCEGIRLGIAWLDETRPEFFSNPSWPLKIAQAVERSITATERLAPVPAPSNPPRFPLRNDTKAKAAYRARKADERQAEAIRQLAAQLDHQNVTAPAGDPPRARLAVPNAAELATKYDDARMKANALRIFPAAGISGTPLHEGIRRGIAWLTEIRPDYFKQENWPELLATAVQNTLDPLDRITPTFTPEQKLEYPPLDDAQAAATYRRYKDEKEYAENLQRLAAQIEKQGPPRKSSTQPPPTGAP